MGKEPAIIDKYIQQFSSDPAGVRMLADVDFCYFASRSFNLDVTYNQVKGMIERHISQNTIGVDDFIEILAINSALQYAEHWGGANRELTPERLKHIDRLLLGNELEIKSMLPGGSSITRSINGGEYRIPLAKVQSNPSLKSTHIDSSLLADLIEKLISWYQSAMTAGQLSPIAVAAVVYYKLSLLQPFEVVSSLVGMIVVNYILAIAHWPVMTFREYSEAKARSICVSFEAGIIDEPLKKFNLNSGVLQPYIDYVSSVYIGGLQFITDSIHSDRVWMYDGNPIKFSSSTSSAILTCLTENPKATYNDLVKTVGINRSAIQKQLKRMSDKGYISRPADSRNAWIVNACLSN